MMATEYQVHSYHVRQDGLVLLGSERHHATRKRWDAAFTAMRNAVFSCVDDQGLRDRQAGDTAIDAAKAIDQPDLIRRSRRVPVGSRVVVLERIDF